MVSLSAGVLRQASPRLGSGAAKLRRLSRRKAAGSKLGDKLGVKKTWRGWNVIGRLAGVHASIVACLVDAFAPKRRNLAIPTRHLPQIHFHQFAVAKSPFYEEGEDCSLDDKKSPAASRDSRSMSDAYSSIMSSITQGSPLSVVTCASIAQVNLNLLSLAATS